MKYAQVTYHGPMRSHHRRGPSGETYHWTANSSDSSTVVDVESLADAQAFERQDVFDVRWTPQGEVARRVGPRAQDAHTVLTELSYTQKQKLVSALDLDVAGNSKEEELEEALEPVVEEMINQRR